MSTRRATRQRLQATSPFFLPLTAQRIASFLLAADSVHLALTSRAAKLALVHGAPAIVAVSLSDQAFGALRGELRLAVAPPAVAPVAFQGVTASAVGVGDGGGGASPPPTASAAAAAAHYAAYATATAGGLAPPLATFPPPDDYGGTGVAGYNGSGGGGGSIDG